jgi:hypothetical protein
LRKLKRLSGWWQTSDALAYSRDHQLSLISVPLDVRCPIIAASVINLTCFSQFIVLTNTSNQMLRHFESLNLLPRVLKCLKLGTHGEIAEKQRQMNRFGSVSASGIEPSLNASY